MTTTGGIMAHNGTIKTRRGSALGPLALVLLAATTVLGLALAPAAHGVLYWSSDGFHRSNLDGTDVQSPFIPSPGPNTGTFAVHGGFIYWGDIDRTNIGRARLDGSQVDVNFIDLPETPIAVAANSSGVYWTEYYGLGRIGRADLDGSNVNENFISTGPSHRVEGGLTADESHIYWGGNTNSGPDAETIGRANTDGTGVTPEFVSIDDTPFAPASIGPLDLSDTHIYWATRAPSAAIGRASLDGSEVTPNLISDAAAGGRVSDVGVGGDHVYWSTDSSGAIGRANLDGTGVDAGFLALPQDAFGEDAHVSDIAADEFVIPNTAITKAPKKKTKKRKVKLEFRSPNAPFAAFECALDKSSFFPCTSPVKLKVGQGKHKFYARAVTVAGPDPSPARARWEVEK